MATPNPIQDLQRDMENRVMARFTREVTTEELFWARVELGMEYLRELHGEEAARRIWKKKTFWAWWRQTWHVNDKIILYGLDENGIDHLRFTDYCDTQAIMMAKWKVNEKVL